MGNMADENLRPVTPNIAGVEHLAYIILDVTYRRDANYGQDLAWVAHELKDAAGLELTEDLLGMKCGRCDRAVEFYKGHWWEGEDFMCPDGEEPHCVADDLFPSRRWAGTITEAEFRSLKSAWSIDLNMSQGHCQIATPLGKLSAEDFYFDGMGWNVGGETPINDVDLHVSAPASWWEEAQS